MEIVNQQPIKVPKIVGRKPKYTQEYMAMVGRKVASGEFSYSQAAKVFNMSEGSVGACVTRFKTGNHGNAEKVKQISDKTQTQRFDAQLREIKLQVAELYLENLMLKKALQYSQQLKKENSSVITSESLEQSQEAAE